MKLNQVSTSTKLAGHARKVTKHQRGIFNASCSCGWRFGQPIYTREMATRAHTTHKQSVVMERDS